MEKITIRAEKSTLDGSEPYCPIKVEGTVEFMINPSDSYYAGREMRHRFLTLDETLEAYLYHAQASRHEARLRWKENHDD